MKTFKLWEMVKELEDNTQQGRNELSEGKVTFLVNYGQSGRCIPGLVDEKDSLVAMIMKVFEHYDNLIKSKT